MCHSVQNPIACPSLRGSDAAQYPEPSVWMTCAPPTPNMVAGSRSDDRAVVTPPQPLGPTQAPKPAENPPSPAHGEHPQLFADSDHNL
jgi:hypothetical protein